MKVERERDTNCTQISPCGWVPGEQMERFVRVSYSLYQGAHYGNTLPLGQPGLFEHRHPYWRHNTGVPTFLARPGLLVPTNASDYCMAPWNRAQPTAILPHLKPSLSLRLFKPHTKEVGVQVSPWVDKSVQCSLGHSLRSLSPGGSTNSKATLPALGVGSLLRKHGEDEERKAISGPTEASQQLLPPRPRSQEDKQSELWQQDKLGEDNASSPGERKSMEAPEDAPDPLPKPNFQFLERKYGYFHCKECKTRWESAFVWCISGTNKVYFKQLCCKCQKSFNPYRVEAIQCQICSKSRCSCCRKKRHIDLRKPHRQELCGRCKDKRFSCCGIYSFKYII